MKIPKSFFSVIVLMAGLISASLIAKHSFQKDHEENKQEEVLTAFEMMGLWGQMRAYPNEQIPEGKFNAAFNKMKSDEERKNKNNSERMGAAMSAAQTSPWVPLAPKNFAGRILCLAFHPTNQSVMWAGSASGGLWKTTNGGTGATNGINWTSVPTGFPVLGISAIAVNPSNANELYVGTGEIYNIGGNGFQGHNDRIFRGSYGIGILKTTDGGTTWIKALDFSASSLKGVADIIINPLKPSTIFAATTDGVYRSHNSGANWTLIHSTIMAMDICMKPGDTSTLFVGAGNFTSTGNGIYKSTNAGAAVPSFTKLTSGLPTSISGMVRLHISANNVNKVYASIGKSPGSSTSSGLYSSTNGGSSWTKASSTAYINNQGWYAHDVVASPSNANTIYVAEMDMYKSTSGGGTLTKVSDWSLWNFNNTTVGTLSEGTTSKYVHADIHHLYISPFSTTTIFAVSDGGVFKSTNSASSFVSLNGGLQTAQIYANMAASTVDPNFMICGLQDNATFLYQGNPGCVRKIGGDGFSAAITPGNDNICFGSLYYFTIYKSTNKGSTFSTVNNNSGDAENACFSAPLVMSKSSPSTMYGGTIYVKKSTNAGTNWSNANGGVILSNSSAPLLKMAVSDYNVNKVYASTVPGGGARSRLFKSTNGASSFTEITSTLPDRYYTDITIDPTNDDRVLVTLSGFGSGHIYYSANGGASWTDISGNLPDAPHNTTIFDPANPQTIVVGNDLGVYYTTGFVDGSVAPEWYPYNDGLSDATMVMDIVVAANNKLRLGTHGKGLWECDMPQPTELITQVTRETPIEKNKANNPVISSAIYPNPATGPITISLNNIPQAGKATVRIYNTTGILQNQYNYELQQGSNVLQSNVSSLRTGTYQIVIDIAGKKIVQKLIRL